MSNLTIHVDRLHRAPLDLDVHLAPEELGLWDDQYDFTSPVRGTVTFRIVGHDILSHGQLTVQVRTECVRCLEQADFTVDVPVREVWMPSSELDEQSTLPEDREDLTHPYQGEEIDPTPVFRELLMAELPLHPHCSPACKGICPGCGVNLNRSACRCTPTEQQGTPDTEPEWKRKLQRLKNEL
mgnify:CR=1 FL=1